jgi:septal ring factor EnvC (AmiA/AmiB activator)
MRYTGKKYSETEAAAIMATARATVAGVHADMQRWRAEQQQRDGADFVCKTITNARVADAPPQQMDATTASWVEWVDARIEAKFNAVIEAVDQALGKMFDTQHEEIQSALDRRDAKIQALRDEVDIKLGLKAKVARLKAEVAEARQQAPNFKTELARLQDEVDKQQKTIVRLRAQNSTLEYQQRLTDAQLAKMKREAASPAAVVEFETSSSRLTVGNLHPDAANALREFASQVVDAWDGGAILFSGPAGTA